MVVKQICVIQLEFELYLTSIASQLTFDPSFGIIFNPVEVRKLGTNQTSLAICNIYTEHRALSLLQTTHSLCLPFQRLSKVLIGTEKKIPPTFCLHL